MSGSTLEFLCQQSLASERWYDANKRRWSAQVKDSSGNVYDITLTIPPQLLFYDDNPEQKAVMAIGIDYWTSDNRQSGAYATYRNSDGSIGDTGDRTSGNAKGYSTSSKLGVAPYFKITLK